MPILGDVIESPELIESRADINPQDVERIKISIIEVVNDSYTAIKRLMRLSLDLDNERERLISDPHIERTIENNKMILLTNTAVPKVAEAYVRTVRLLDGRELDEVEDFQLALEFPKQNEILTIKT